MLVEFRVLGPLEAWSNGARIELGGHRQQRFVAALALHAGVLVPWERLCELVWDAGPPTNAVKRLRRSAITLAKNATVEINDLGCGLLHDHVDLRSFEELVEQERLREALALWRGPALAGITGGVLGELAYQLDMRRAEVWEQCADSLSDLTELVEAFPLRERSVELLMRAQFGAGLADEAVDTYHRFRTRLVVERHKEPSRELRQLFDDVKAARVPVPEQVPADVACFVGRAEQLDALDPNGVTLISGIAGVGKTALAVRWANSVRDRFPDGQLYVNLRGYHNSQPVSANTALKTFLQALGAPRIPDRLADRVDLFQSLVKGKRVLVVLDNAAIPEQVVPLLAPGCTVVITSRDLLIPNARQIHLDVLSARESEELLKLVLGEQRVAAEPGATRALANACGHLPLTLRVVAGNLVGREGHRIADAVGDLVMPSVEVACTRSYKMLPTPARTLLRYLGCIPGGDITVDVMSALLGAPAEKPLATLEAANLIIRHQPGRYRLHDLVRRYAIARSAAEDDEQSLNTALTRWLDHLTATADAAGLVLLPSFDKITRPPRDDVPEFSDATSAALWFTVEHQNLMAAVSWANENGFDDRCAHLVDALRVDSWASQDTADWILAARMGLASAQRCGDTRLRAAMHRTLGMAVYARGDTMESLEHDRRALALFEELDDSWSTVAMLINVASGHDTIGEPAKALELRERALTIVSDSDRLETTIVVLGGNAMTLARMGRPREAVELAEQCLSLTTEQNPHQQAFARFRLAYAQIETGELDRAEANMREAVWLNGANKYRYMELFSLIGLGRVHLRAGDRYRAAEIFEFVVAEAETTGSMTLLADALTGLADARIGRQSAVEQSERALSLYRNVSDVFEQVAALAVLSEAHLALGDTATAAAHAEEALAVAQQHDVNRHLGRVLRVQAAIHTARGEHDRARPLAVEAVEQHRRTGQRLFEAEDHVALAHVLLATGDAQAGLRHEIEATRICHELVGPRAPDLLHAMRLRTKSPRQPS